MEVRVRMCSLDIRKWSNRLECAISSYVHFGIRMMVRVVVETKVGSLEADANSAVDVHDGE